MIFVVDDDASIAEMTSDALTADGHKVVTFDHGGRAVEQAVEEEPDLIISDIMMPEMGGFEFKEAYGSRFPNRNTPFIFLSSLSDSGSIVKGLDLGADDYLTKPVNPEILRAKVRSVLSRKRRYSVPMFYGDMTRLPFEKLIQFCELKGFTGEIEITQGDSLVKFQIKGGNIILENVDDTVLEKLYESGEGTFKIFSHPLDFREIEDSSVSSKVKTAVIIDSKDKPMGRLSGVKADNRLFQLQTEFVTYPENQVLTIVILDGKVLMKRKKAIPPESLERKAIEKIIEEQHTSVEHEVKAKIDELTRKKTDSKESPKEKYTLLFENGFEKYREGKYEEALAVWQEACKLNPGDKILLTNISILRKKLKLD